MISGVLVESRKQIFVSVDAVVGVIALEKDGPTRLLLADGCAQDVCGPAEEWVNRIQIAKQLDQIESRIRARRSFREPR